MNNIDKMLGNIMGKSKTTKLKTNNKVLNNFGLTQFGGRNDLDFDGVPNRKDCQPRNTMRQDKKHNKQWYGTENHMNVMPRLSNIKTDDNILYKGDAVEVDWDGKTRKAVISDIFKNDAGWDGMNVNVSFKDHENPIPRSRINNSHPEWAMVSPSEVKKINNTPQLKHTDKYIFTVHFENVPYPIIVEAEYKDQAIMLARNKLAKEGRNWDDRRNSNNRILRVDKGDKVYCPHCQKEI